MKFLNYVTHVTTLVALYSWKKTKLNLRNALSEWSIKQMLLSDWFCGLLSWLSSWWKIFHQNIKESVQFHACLGMA